jgi:DNA-binding transcriptional LysR family regulator
MTTDKTRIERRLKLHDLRLLMSVVEEGSMSKAAERLATSQPAISRTIADLEQSLGVRLLDRGPQGIVPTPYGRALLKRSVTVFDELRLGVEDLQSLTDPTAGEIRIAAPLALSTGFVPAVIDRLSRHYPRVVCRLRTDEAGDVFRRLEDREVDLAIAFLTSAVDRDRMETDVLFSTDPAVVVAGTKNTVARRRNLRLADLMDEPWALIPPDSEFSYADRIFRSAGLDPPAPAMVATSVIARLALVARGRFLTIASEPLLRFGGYGTSLKILPVSLPSVPYNVGVVTLKNRTLTPAAQLFIDCARDVAKVVTTQKPSRTLPRRTRGD